MNDYIVNKTISVDNTYCRFHGMLGIEEGKAIDENSNKNSILKWIIWTSQGIHFIAHFDSFMRSGTYMTRSETQRTMGEIYMKAVIKKLQQIKGLDEPKAKQLLKNTIVPFTRIGE